MSLTFSCPILAGFETQKLAKSCAGGSVVAHGYDGMREDRTNGFSFTMKTPLLAVLALCLHGFSTPDVERPDAKRPNILLVIADDVGIEMLRPYGTGKGFAKTPTINSLAKRSVIFRNAWSSPVCSPTRACIQTGRFGFRTGVGMTVKNTVNFDGLQSSEVILPEMLDAGTDRTYQHALFGKWHLNHSSAKDKSGAPTGADVVRVQGYGHFEGIIHNIVAPDSYFDWPKVTNGVSSRSGQYATTATVDDFLAWRSTVKEPYFAVISFNAPHAPLHTPPSGLFSIDLSGSLSPKVNPRDYYKAMLEALDTELGRLLDGISSELDNTSIIFMGDNGTPGLIVSTDPNAIVPAGHEKGTVYQGGVNVPLMISGPTVEAAGSECSGLVHAVDIFATVADLAGVNLLDPTVFPANRKLDSISLVPYLKDSSLRSVRRVNFTEKFYENTRAGAQVDEEQLTRPPFCQQSVELTASSEGPTLSMCGQAMVERTNNTATIRITNAPPGARVFLLAGGNKPSPNPLYDNLVTLSPKPMAKLVTSTGKVNVKKAFTANAEGTFELAGIVHQVSNPTDYFLQAAVQDPITKRWAITNAVQVNQTINAKGIVSADGYKLVAQISGGPTELYFLPADPNELNDLLGGGVESLNASEREAYKGLRHELRMLLKSAERK